MNLPQHVFDWRLNSKTKSLNRTIGRLASVPFAAYVKYWEKGTVTHHIKP